ncbi:MAG: DUF5658 family protein [Myxococcota bacterium]
MDILELRRPSWVTRVLGAVMIFNLIDLALTVGLVTLDLAEEANPLMAVMLDIHPGLFGITKLTMVSAGVLIMERYSRLPIAQAGAVTAFGVYISLMIWHLQSVAILFFA